VGRGGGGHRAGGGGAGGLLHHTNQTMSSGQKTIVVGNGGIGGTDWENIGLMHGKKGYDTTFTGLTTAVGGGGGRTHMGSSKGEPTGNSNGGSGGGGAQDNQVGVDYIPGNGTPGQGFNGGYGYDTSGQISGGGGGAGGAGQDATSTKAGNGGIGLDKSSVFGTTYGDSGWFASGGGGSSATNGFGTASQGGGTGGTNDSTNNGIAADAQNHTGGGGGGGANDSGSNSAKIGGNGGSGIVIIKSSDASMGKKIPKVTGASFDSTNVTFTVQGSSGITNIKYTINGGSEQTTPVGTLAVAHGLSASASITVVAYAVDANGDQISAKKTVTGTIPLLFTNFPSTIAFTGWWNDEFSRWYQLTSNTDTFIQYELYDASGLVGAEYGSTFTLNSSGILFNVEDTGDTSTPYSYSNGGTFVGTSGIVEVGDSITLWASSDGSGTAEAVFTVPNFFS
jgi:hypothetical protein